MNQYFAETLRRFRKHRGYSQQQVADKIFVSRSTIAKWETGTRLPDVSMIRRLAGCLGLDTSTLLNAAAESEELPVIILVDDEQIILRGGLPVLEEVFPNAEIIGFASPADALEFAKANRIALAFLDIEMGRVSGLDLCASLRELDPNIRVIFLTGYAEFALDAWQTGASGFLVKPLTAGAIRKLLALQRIPGVGGIKA